MVMGILEDIKAAQEMLSKLPPMPRQIKMTRRMYYAVEKDMFIKRHMQDTTCSLNPFPWSGIQLYLEDDFTEWTDEEKKKGFKVVY